MKTTIEKPVNALKFQIVTEAKGMKAYIDIRLSDDCKNGHNDFAITANIYEAGKPKADKYMITGGACHDTILEIRPDLKLFVDLHLCDVNGAPMYTVANGFYHLKNSSPEMAREYIRATQEEFEVIKTAEDETMYAYLLERLDLITRWKQEAQEAIKLLEEWTGQQFQDNSVKSNFTPLGHKVAEVEKMINAGYYTPEKIQERENQKREQKREKIAANLKADRDQTIKKAEIEYAVKMAVHTAGLSLKNFIYYNHTNEGVFNWLDYENKITPEQLEAFKQSVEYSKLPEGIQFKIKG